MGLNASGLCSGCASQTARDGGPRTPSPCPQHGVRYGHYGLPPFDKQPGRPKCPKRPTDFIFGSGITTPHLASQAIVAPVLLWAASAMVLRCRCRSVAPRFGPARGEGSLVAIDTLCENQQES